MDTDSLHMFSDDFMAERVDPLPQEREALSLFDESESATMNLALAEQIANAVLYEGHILYPYRPSSVKNRQRWTFGAVFPQASSLVQAGSETAIMQTECLVEGDPHTVLAVRVRFLHLQDRIVG